MSVPNLITCEVDGIQYLLHPQVLGSTEAPIKADQVIPVLLLTEEELSGTPDQIGQLLQYYVETDDVCSPSFTDILVEKPSKDSSSNLFMEKKDDSFYSSKATYRLQKTVLHTSSTDNPEAREDDYLPSGPYFLSGPNLHQAYRLYPDTQNAFVYGMIPNDVHNPSGFQAVSFLASDSMSKTIPVPSRHYTRLTTRGQKRPSPIRGKRITLTDGLSLIGTQTTLSCKAYVDTYPPATETDAYVQRLLEEGAVLVGKTKTSQLRIGSSMWPETHFPANPRAARKGNVFDCNGTAVGSTSALAGYSWLEYAVSGNVDSAVRESGKRYGLYGLRRSLAVEHDKPSPGPNDSVGIFGRSLHDLSTLAECTFSPLTAPAKEPSRYNINKILYLDYAKDQELEYAMDVFVNALERHLNVARTTVNLDEEWEKYRVKSGIDFSLRKTARFLYDLNHYDEYAKFRKDYQAKFHSSRGLVDLEAQALWSSARDHVKRQRKLQDQVNIFRDWLEQHILATKPDTATCHSTGDTIIVIPDINFYHYHIIGFFGRVLAMEDILSPQTVTPQLSVPFTQNPGECLGDEQTYSPVVASVIGPRMTVTSLITLITQALKASGLPTSVQPGPLCFPLPSSSSSDATAADATADATTATAAADATTADSDDKNNDDGNDEAGPTAVELQGRAAVAKLHPHEMWLYSEQDVEEEEEDDEKTTTTVTSEQGKKLRGAEDRWGGETLAKSSLDIRVDLRGLKK